MPVLSSVKCATGLIFKATLEFPGGRPSDGTGPDLWDGLTEGAFGWGGKGGGNGAAHYERHDGRNRSSQEITGSSEQLAADQSSV